MKTWFDVLEELCALGLRITISHKGEILEIKWRLSEGFLLPG